MGGLVVCDAGAGPAADGGLEPRPRPGPEAEPRVAEPPLGPAGVPEGRDELSETLSLGLPPRPLLRAVPLMASRCLSVSQWNLGKVGRYEV